MNIHDWEQQIKVLRQRLGYPDGRDMDAEDERLAMADKWREEAAEFMDEASFAAVAPNGPHRYRMLEEGGDALVMLMANLAAHGFTLGDIMQEALTKLTRRAEERSVRDE